MSAPPVDGHTLGLIELTLVFGGVIGWGWWELRSLRLAKQRTARERTGSGAGAGAGAESDRAPGGEPINRGDPGEPRA